MDEPVHFYLAANIEEGRNYFEVCPQGSERKKFRIETIHISSRSDPFLGRNKYYGGIIIYGRKDEEEWITENGTHCKSGHVVIMQTDSKEFKKLQKKWLNEPGQVHGIIYREAFGESCNDVNVVGEGFGIINGEFTTKSFVFNSPDDGYHNDNWEMHPHSTRCVRKVVEWWKAAGSSYCDSPNHPVERLLSSADD